MIDSNHDVMLCDRRLRILDVLAEIPAVSRVNDSSLDSTILLSSLHSISSVSNHSGVPAESTSSPGLAPVDSIFVVVRTIRCVLLAFVFCQDSSLHSGSSAYRPILCLSFVHQHIVPRAVTNHGRLSSHTPGPAPAPIADGR